MSKYPTLNAIKNADAAQINKWFRELPYPTTEEDRQKLEAIVERKIEFQRIGA